MASDQTAFAQRHFVVWITNTRPFLTNTKFILQLLGLGTPKYVKNRNISFLTAISLNFLMLTF